MDLAKSFSKLSLENVDSSIIEKLKSLDSDYMKEEEELQKKILALEAEFRQKVKPLFTERDEYIVSKKVNGFWLRALANNNRIQNMIEECDIPILEKLTNITIDFPNAEDQSFNLIFTFDENDYFTNTTLTKKYNLILEGGMESLESIESTPIEWKEGKEVTKKVVTKVQRNKRTAQTRTVSETIENNSFFHFFRSHTLPSDEAMENMNDDEISELHVLMQADFEAARKIREYIVPRAITWFLGEGEDSDEEDMYEDEDEDEEDEEEDEEEEAQEGEDGKKEKCEQQ